MNDSKTTAKALQIQQLQSAIARLEQPRVRGAVAVASNVSRTSVTADQSSDLRFPGPDLRTPASPPARRLGGFEDETEAVSTGIPGLDQLLPQRGLVPGTLTEWLAEETGSGAVQLAMLAAREALQNGPLIVIDWPPMIYPPALERIGVPLEQTVFVRPDSLGDALWALEQSLRSPVPGAVFSRVGRLSSRVARRLQLAAEAGSTVGLLLRPGTARGQANWADVRFGVAPVPLGSSLRGGAQRGPAQQSSHLSSKLQGVHRGEEQRRRADFPP